MSKFSLSSSVCNLLIAVFVVILLSVSILIALAVKNSRKVEVLDAKVKSEGDVPEFENKNTTDQSPEIIIPDPEKDLDFILAGISEIERYFTPGGLTLYGKNAFPILVGEHRSYLQPIVGAGYYGRGRYATYTHSTSLLNSNQSKFDNEKLFRNLVLWAAGSEKTKNITAGFCVHRNDIERFRNALSPSGIIVKIFELNLASIKSLSQFDVVLLNKEKSIRIEEVEVLRQYIISGGGLILSPTPWSHQDKENTPGSTFQQEFWGNKILNPMGSIAFTRNYAYKTSTLGLNASKSFLENTQADKAWTDVKQLIHKQQSIKSEKLKQMQYILVDRLMYAPKSNFSIEIVEEFGNLLSPTSNSTTPQFFENFSKGDDQMLWDDMKTSLQQGKFFEKQKMEQIKPILIEQLSNSTYLKDYKFVNNIFGLFTEIILKSG